MKRTRPAVGRSFPRRSSALLSPRSRRAFTMLELVLAMVLGALVIAGAMSLFRVLERSQVRQQTRMDENMQMARAHKVVGLVFQSLLMAPADVSERDVEARLEEDDLRNSEDRLSQRDEGADEARLSLQPDPALGARMVVATDRGERLAPAQSFVVTLRQSPVASGEDKSEQELDRASREREFIIERALARTGGGRSVEDLRAEDRRAGSSMDSGRDESGSPRAGSPARSRDRSGSSSRRSGVPAEAADLIDRAVAGGSDGARSRRGSRQDDLTASERLEDVELSRPRAPGVRGVFEILPDGVEPGAGLAAPPSEFAATADGPTYSLWWRELPPRPAEEDLASEGVGVEDDAGERSERDDRRRRADAELVALAAESEFNGKRERLLSGCRSIHWSALRGKKPRDKITALYDKELPAYVELEFETVSGRREKWMFEVAWITGPEPGSVLPERADALDTIAAATVNTTDPNDPNYRAPDQPDDPSKQNNPDNPNVTDPRNPNNPNSPLRPKVPTPPPNKPGELNNPSIIKPTNPTGTRP